MLPCSVGTRDSNLPLPVEVVGVGEVQDRQQQPPRSHRREGIRRTHGPEQQQALRCAREKAEMARVERAVLRRKPGRSDPQVGPRAEPCRRGPRTRRGPPRRISSSRRAAELHSRNNRNQPRFVPPPRRILVVPNLCLNRRVSLMRPARPPPTRLPELLLRALRRREAPVAVTTSRTTSSSSPQTAARSRTRSSAGRCFRPAGKG